ncbi:MAG: 3'-5' exonuclease [Bacillales bacterium]|nr:3'-5' exonuclease [Bacillales bacterium]
MDYRTLLNEQQYKAVSTDSQYVRVVAGAGSGKTRTLTYRISYLIGEKGFRPSSILAITFTNKAASEMKQRAISLVPQAKTTLSISTFHSFCARFLRQEIDLLGFSNDFQIIDDDDQLQMIKDIAVANGFKKKDPIVKYALNFISHQKCIGNYPEDVSLNSHCLEEDKTSLKFYSIYEDQKDLMGKLDFDDLLLKTIQVLSSSKSTRDKWRNKYSNILIDEFQDTNDIQFKLVKLLMGEHTNLYVVGDPDQTIYTWRGANQNIILQFESTFRNAETIILNENYRSTQNILNAANKLISFNKKRVPKDLFTSNIKGDKVEFVSSISREAEARNVAHKIEIYSRLDPNFSYKDVAILYRAAYLTLPIEKEFMQRRLPYVIYGGIKFFQRKEIKDILAYFNLIYNKKDDLSFKRIINVPKRDIGEKTISVLEAEKQQAGLSFFEYIEHIKEFDTELRTKNILALTNLINAIKDVKNKLNDNLEAYPSVLQKFIEDIGYYDYLKNDEDGEDRIDNVQTLFDDILTYVKNNPDSTFQSYLENAMLQTSQDEIKDGDFISLMTVHVAKGLEFKYVFVIGLNQGVFPSDRTTIESGEDGLEEERRLCYVAFTRAKQKLHVSCNRSYSYVLGCEGIQSQFVKESGISTQERPYVNSNQSIFNNFSSTIKPASKQTSKQEAVTKSQQTNGITDWKVGDLVNHEKFGKGVVIEVVDQTIVKINFDKEGVKSILSSHRMLTRYQGGHDA